MASAPATSGSMSCGGGVGKDEYLNHAAILDAKPEPARVISNRAFLQIQLSDYSYRVVVIWEAFVKANELGYTRNSRQLKPWLPSVKICILLQEFLNGV
jgi:hypothetical protein